MNKFKLLFFVGGTIIMIVVMAITGKDLKTPVTPIGIFDLELAATGKDVQIILSSWGQVQEKDLIKMAKYNTYWDFIFLFFYSGLLYLLCYRFKNVYRPETSFAKAGSWLAKAAIAAGVLDAIENICMLQSLNNSSANWLPMLTAICAGLKFTILIIIILYLALSGVLGAYSKVRPA
jgi:hypothetical protein